jgi:hypothetical protein
MAPTRILQAAAIALAPALAFAPAAFAAHAGAPYTNVDHSNDMGNDTGDSKVDGLNAQQLNENYHGPLQMRPPANMPSPTPPTVAAPLSPPAPPQR